MTLAIKVRVSVPCFGGKIEALCARSLMGLQHELQKLDAWGGIDMELHESLVQRARNSLVHYFLCSDATHLLFVDADIQFNPIDVIGMIGADKPLVCGAYPKKTIDVGALGRAFAAGDTDPMSKAASFAINVVSPGLYESAPTVTSEDGCVPILDAPTGFMLVRRDVFLQMAAEMPELLYYSDRGSDRGEAMHAFFDCAIEDGRYLSEDYLFSRRWQKLGGTVWCFLPAALNHIGSYTYRGDLGSVFEPMEAA